MANERGGTWTCVKRLLRIIEVIATIFAVGTSLFCINSYKSAISVSGNMQNEGISSTMQEILNLSIHSEKDVYVNVETDSSLYATQENQVQETYKLKASIGQFESGVGVVALFNAVPININEVCYVKPGDVISAYAYSVFEIAFIGYYISENGNNTQIVDANDNKVNISIPSYPDGTHVKLYVEAVSVNNTGDDDYYFRSGWVKYELVIQSS